MPRSYAGNGWRHLRQLFGAGTAVGLTDRQLLERFACGSGPSDSTTAAFETILARHGSMVLAVCRQILGDPHAVEDAFQATFLVLVRRAGSLRLRDGGSLGPWLHGVAYRTAMKSRKISARRQVRERRVAAAVSELCSTPTESDDLRFLVHEEVNRLPTKYRAPVVLCYFEGRTHDEAAAALHWPVGTVRGRLARARDLLRARLTRRGLAPGVLVGTSWFDQSTRAEVTASLRDATVAAVTKGVPVGSGVAALTSVVLRSLLLARMKIAAAFILAISVLAIGAGFVAPGRRGVPQSAVIKASPVANAVDELAPPVDRFGDPLPKYARTRLGSMRFRHGDGLRQAIFTPDGRFVVSTGGFSGTCVWDAATGTKLREIGDSANRLQEFAFSPDGRTLATIESAGGLRLRDFATGREQRQWHVTKNEYYQRLAFSPDGRFVAAGASRFDEATKNEEKFINVWDTAASTERRRRLAGNWLFLNDLKFSHDGTTLATASNDTESNIVGQKPEKGSTRIWDLATGKERKRFAVEGCNVRSVAFSPDGKLLAASVSDGTIRFYDLATGRERSPRLRCETDLPPPRVGPAPAPGAPASDARPGVMQCLIFSPDSSILAGGSDWPGNTGESTLAAVHIWNVARREELLRIPAHQGIIESLAFSPDGKTVATTGSELVIRLWDVASGNERLPQEGHRSWIRTLAISPTDGTVFTAGQDGTVRQWDPRSGRELGVFASFAEPVHWMAFPRDGKTLLLGSPTMPGSQGLRLWSVAERREIRRLSRIEEARDFRHVGFFMSAAYSPDGKERMTLDGEGLRISDVASGKHVRWAVRSSLDTYHPALSPDGRVVATREADERRRGGTPNSAIRLWELASGQEVARLEVPADGTSDLAFSPDGRFLVACCHRSTQIPHDQVVRIWDVGTGQEMRHFAGHLGLIWCAAFAPDGRSVISGGTDGTALVWDVSDLMSRPNAEPLTPDALKQRWNELANVDARIAYRASWALSVPSAVAFLGDRLSSASTQAQKRSVVTEGASGPPEVLRTIRAVAAIERVGTPDARRTLERLAEGDPAALSTKEARSALTRLRNRKN
jgi:RNA polymerase sigma factor (sigma-70 family)